MGRVVTVHMEVPGDKFAQICKERSEWERFIVYPNISVLKWLFLRHDLFRCTSSSTWGHKSLPTLHTEEFHALETLFDRSDKFIHSETYRKTIQLMIWLKYIHFLGKLRLQCKGYLPYRVQVPSSLKSPANSDE